MESVEGEGATFKVYLPLSDQASSNMVLSEKQIIRGRGERVLLVDDEDFFLDVMTHLLEKLNYRPEATTSSREALERFLKRPDGFDLIVTDQTMPEMTGVQLASEVRKVNGEIPVILCTGFSENICEKTANFYGITRFLMKPVTRDAISRALSEALGHGSERKGTFVDDAGLP